MIKILLVCLLLAPPAFARGGGPGMGGFGGGLGGKAGPGFSQPGTAPGMKHMATKHSASSEQALADLEDRKNLISERRKRLAESDRAANQEERLAAGRLANALKGIDYV